MDIFLTEFLNRLLWSDPWLRSLNVKMQSGGYAYHTVFKSVFSICLPASDNLLAKVLHRSVFSYC